MSEAALREELRQSVGRIYAESLAGIVWKKVGRIFGWLPGSHAGQAPLWLASLAVLLLAALICALLAWLTVAVEVFSRFGLGIIVSSLIWMWLSISLADWQIRENLDAIRKDALEILELPAGQVQVQEWVRIVTSRRTQVITAIVFVLLVCTLSSFAMRLDLAQPVGRVVLLGILLATGWWTFHLTGIAALFLFYGYYFSRWPTSLFRDEPASTVSLLILHRRAGQLLLAAAFIIALSIPVGWIAKMLTPDMLLVTGLSLWIPMLVFFAAAEHSFSVQIGRAKDNRLADLQEQIVRLERQGNPPDIGTAEHIQKLLAIHGEVRRSPNSLVNPESLLNLFGALGISLAGVLVKILDAWRTLWGVP